MIRKLILLSAALLSQSLLAGELSEGQWEGKVTMHDKPPEKAVFRVRSKQGADDMKYKIEMFYIERPYKFTELRIDENEMRFSIDTGEKYDCVLSLDGDAKNELEACRNKQGYCGQCLHEDDGEVREIIISMQPPLDSPPASETDAIETSEEPD